MFYGSFLITLRFFRPAFQALLVNFFSNSSPKYAKTWIFHREVTSAIMIGSWNYFLFLWHCHFPFCWSIRNTFVMRPKWYAITGKLNKLKWRFQINDLQIAIHRSTLSLRIILSIFLWNMQIKTLLLLEFLSSGKPRRFYLHFRLSKSLTSYSKKCVKL